MKPESEWPWIARIARDLDLHSTKTIQVALLAQEQNPLRPLDSFLAFGEAARETVADFLDQDRPRYIGDVEDGAFAQWGLAEGQFDEATLERARAAQKEKPPGTRLWSVFQDEEGLELAKPVTGSPQEYLCSLCNISIEVQASLFPFVRSCPGCGAVRPEHAPPSHLEAQLWLSDEAYGLWAIKEAGVPKERVDAARKKTGAMALFEVLVHEGLVGLNEAMEALRGEIALVCSKCATGYQLGFGLLPYLDDLPCPLCKGSIERKPNALVEAGEGMEPTQSFRVIGPYTLLHQIGRGGMSDVYLGEDPQGTRIALKTLSGRLAGDDDRLRFEREGMILSRLKHPNIVSTVGSGVDKASERPYLALELIEGRNLGAILEDRPEGRMTLEETIFTIEHVSRALIYAHSKGVIHRDIKPQNVLITVDGRVKLTDFGIAIAEDGTSRITSKHELLGTPEYVAPEVLKSDAWSPAADIYALGVFAYRALHGKTPFEGDSPEQVAALKNASEAPRLRDTIREIPAPFSELVANMLDKDPSQRPTAEEFGRRLSDCAQDTTRPSALRRLFREASEGLGTLSASGEVNRLVRLENGQVFQHYKVEEEVGRGGMGVVYKAHHLGLDRTVALKILVAGALASDDERRRFLREAQAAGGLQHKNVVPILDAGEHEGTYFLTMEHVRGEPMGLYAARIEDQNELLSMFCQICDGVAHAHSRGVIHRDLKPENVLVMDDGTPRILDFGIAKRLDEQEESKHAALTSEGDILGTVRYMPPEQAAGQIHHVDVRSDVYALGSMLFELVVGQTPFNGSIREILHQVHFVEPQPPSATDANLPWELDAICLKALEKDRDDRYQSALELKQDVERFLQRLPIRARRATLWYRFKKWATRNKRSAAGIFAASAMVLILLVGLGWTLVTRENRRREQVLDSTVKGWEQFEAHDFQAALDEFNTAIRDCSPDDVLPLSPAGSSLLPESIREGLHEEERAAPRVTRHRLREWAALARHRLDGDKVKELVVSAREQFENGRLSRASETLLLGKNIAPDHPGLIKLSKEVAKDLVRIGRTWMTSSSENKTFSQRREGLERARDVIEEARRLDEESPEVLEAAFEVAGELGKLTELEQAAALRAQNVAHSIELTKKAAVELLSGDLESARRGLEQALAFDGSSKDAREGLIEVERKLAERLRADEQRVTLAKVERLVGEGRKALARGELEAARTSFIQALAFDGGSVSARDGLVEVDRIVQSRERIESDRKRERLAEELVLKGQKQHEEGRALFRRGALPEDVRERYFASVETLKRALFVVPGYPRAQEQLNLVGREFSGVLVDQGHSELSKFILRIAGADPTEQVVVALPHDPYLIIREENRVNIRRAFGGGVMRFAPTRAFDPLRDWVKAQGARYRVVIGIRSDAVRRAIHHPQVFLKGFSIRIEDLERSTISPAIRFELDDDDTYERAVVVDGQGRRLMRSFDTATGLDSGKVVARVTKLVQAELNKRIKPSK